MIMDSKLAFILFLIKLFILIEMIIQEFLTTTTTTNNKNNSHEEEDQEEFDEKFNNNYHEEEEEEEQVDDDDDGNIIYDEEKSFIYNTITKQYESRPITPKKKNESRITLQEFIFFIICFIMIIFDWIVIYTNA